MRLVRTRVRSPDTQAAFADAVNVAAFFLTKSCTLSGPCRHYAFKSNYLEEEVELAIVLRFRLREPFGAKLARSPE
jgi:hypothetical protein